MMLKLNSTLRDNSFIDSYSMRISAASGGERVFSRRQLATARGADIGLNGRDYSMSLARRLPRHLRGVFRVTCAASSAGELERSRRR